MSIARLILRQTTHCAIGIFFALFFVSVSFADGQTFSNFDIENQLHAIQLSSVEDSDLRYFRLETGGTVAITNRIIVKTNGLKLVDFFQLNIGVTEQELLAELGNSQLYLLYIESVEQVFTVIEKLKKLTTVVYAQPDFLQLSVKKLLFGEGTELHNAVSPKQALNLPSPVFSATKNSVRIAIIDDGFDLSHPAFAKTHVGFSFDIRSRTSNVQPRIAADKHGTMVAGILFAQQAQPEISGLMPKATLLAIRRIQNWTSDTVLAFYLAYLANADVIHCSWGMPMLFEPMTDTIDFIVSHGREERGLPIVFSAGNKKQVIDQSETIQSYPAVISVSAIDQNKRISGNLGSVVDLYARAGIQTVDARDHSKRVMLGGSSSAAPLVTGVIALLLSEQPELTLTDLKQLLTETSTPLSLYPGQAGEINAQALLEKISMADRR